MHRTFGETGYHYGLRNRHSGFESLRVHNNKREVYMPLFCYSLESQLLGFRLGFDIPSGVKKTERCVSLDKVQGEHRESGQKQFPSGN